MLKKLFNANSVKDINELIKLLESKYDTEWIPVGNNESNHSTFQMLERGENGIIERLTNAIDAVIEKEYFLNPDENLNSPRKSSEKYFGIKEGNLANYNIKDIKKELKDLVKLNVLESNKKGRPTIEIRDYGIGLSSEEFGKTILSLQGGNKLKKFYLAGTFGQGGSTANIFSKHTLFISKPIPEKNNSNKISFTITKEFDDLDYKTPIHKYLVLKSTKCPITVEDYNNEFEPGTLVRHIEMNINQYGRSSAKAPGDNSIYHFVNKKLFNPILPIKITENRLEVDRTNIERNNNTIVALGCNSRLNDNSNVKYSDKLITEYIFGGTITINYWIINDKNSYKNYNDKSTPVLYTINGQVEGYETANFFEKIGKPYLLNHLIVNVDCDGMDDRIKARLFTSDRTKFQDNDYTDTLRKKVINILTEDMKLVEFNRFFKEQMLSESSENISDELNKKIENKLKVFLNTGGIGKVSKEIPTPKPPRPTPPEPFEKPELFNFPTFLDISNQEQYELPINKDLVLNYISDADHEKYSMEDNLNFIIEKENMLIFDGFKFYKNGHGIINYKLAPEVKVGDEIFFKLFIKGFDDDSNLSSSIMIKIVDKEKDDQQNTEQTKQPPKINTRSVFKTSQEFDELFGEDEELPSVLRDSDESIDIFINMENKSLRKLQENTTKGSNDNDSVKILNNEYIKQIAYYSLILHINESKKSDDEKMNDKSKSEELKRVAILITGMINDNLSIYITESGNNNGIEESN